MPQPLFNVYTFMVLNDNKCFYLLPPYRSLRNGKIFLWQDGGGGGGKEGEEGTAVGGPIHKKFYYGVDNFKHGENWKGDLMDLLALNCLRAGNFHRKLSLSWGGGVGDTKKCQSIVNFMAFGWLLWAASWWVTVRVTTRNLSCKIDARWWRKRSIQSD